MTRVLLWLACAAALTNASAAELGRLFFTPAERAQLDAARTQKKAAAPPAAAEIVEKPMPQVVTYGGLVRRSDGKAMLWLNDRLLEEKEALGGPDLKGNVRADGAVTLHSPHAGVPVNVKVGQSVELRSGRIAEGRKLESTEASAVLRDKSDVSSGKLPPASTKRTASGADAAAEKPSSNVAALAPADDKQPQPVASK